MSTLNKVKTLAVLCRVYIGSSEIQNSDFLCFSVNGCMSKLGHNFSQIWVTVIVLTVKSLEDC